MSTSVAERGKLKTVMGAITIYDLAPKIHHCVHMLQTNCELDAL